MPLERLGGHNAVDCQKEEPWPNPGRLTISRASDGGWRNSVWSARRHWPGKTLDRPLTWLHLTRTAGKASGGCPVQFFFGSSSAEAAPSMRAERGEFYDVIVIIGTGENRPDDEPPCAVLFPTTKLQR